MSTDRAEIIFVAGPQSGQGGLLAGNSITLGRDADCQVRVVEKTISRQQLRLSLTEHGWVLENLSKTNPVRINGKKYKRRKKVILDTGDVIEIGAETKVLFVAAGDDTQAAVAAYRQAQAELAPPPPEEEEPQEPEPQELAEDELLEAADQLEVGEPLTYELKVEVKKVEKAEIVEEDELTRARKAKVRKYLIGAGIYVVVMIGMVVMFATMKKGDVKQTPGGDELTKLTRRDVIESIDVPLDVPAYETEADEALQKAKAFYAGEVDRPGDLYRAVKYFKLYLAFKGGIGFEDTRDEFVFGEAKRKLADRVYEMYSQAWVYEQHKDWATAIALYESLLRTLPAMEEPYPEKTSAILRNVMNHLAYARVNMKKETSRRRRR